jgi:hypothetical protein
MRIQDALSQQALLNYQNAVLLSPRKWPTVWLPL